MGLPVGKTDRRDPRNVYSTKYPIIEEPVARLQMGSVKIDDEDNDYWDPNTQLDM